VPCVCLVFTSTTPSFILSLRPSQIALSSGFSVVLCIGEQLADREAGTTMEVAPMLLNPCTSFPPQLFSSSRGAAFHSGTRHTSQHMQYTTQNTRSTQHTTHGSRHTAHTAHRYAFVNWRRCVLCCPPATGREWLAPPPSLPFSPCAYVCA
jgi:hypothetical protein